MKRRVPELHYTVWIASGEPCLVFCVSRGKLAAHNS